MAAQNTAAEPQFSFDNMGVIFKREFATYFNTAIGYITLFFFSVLLNFLWFYLANFWEIGKAVMDGYWQMTRIVYILFIPAITMRLWAEEKRSGTIEMLLTLPFRDIETIVGKFLSAVAFLGVTLLSTIMVPVMLQWVSSPDWSLIIGGYLGSLLMGASYIALGLYISWLTKDQIVAFLITAFACFLLFIMGYQPFLQLMGPFAGFFSFLSTSWHFDNLARGVLDTRDIIYYATFISLFLYLNKRSIETNR